MKAVVEQLRQKQIDKEKLDQENPLIDFGKSPSSKDEDSAHSHSHHQSSEEVNQSPEKKSILENTLSEVQEEDKEWQIDSKVPKNNAWVQEPLLLNELQIVSEDPPA